MSNLRTDHEGTSPIIPPTLMTDGRFPHTDGYTSQKIEEIVLSHIDKVARIDTAVKNIEQWIKQRREEDRDFEKNVLQVIKNHETDANDETFRRNVHIVVTERENSKTDDTFRKNVKSVIKEYEEEKPKTLRNYASALFFKILPLLCSIVCAYFVIQDHFSIEKTSTPKMQAETQRSVSPDK